MKRAAIYLRVSTVDQTTANRERSYGRSPNAPAGKSQRSTRTTASASNPACGALAGAFLWMQALRQS